MSNRGLTSPHCCTDFPLRVVVLSLRWRHQKSAAVVHVTISIDARLFLLIGLLILLLFLTSFGLLSLFLISNGHCFVSLSLSVLLVPFIGGFANFDQEPRVVSLSDYLVGIHQVALILGTFDAGGSELLGPFHSFDRVIGGRPCSLAVLLCAATNAHEEIETLPVVPAGPGTAVFPLCLSHAALELYHLTLGQVRDVVLLHLFVDFLAHDEVVEAVVVHDAGKMEAGADQESHEAEEDEDDGCLHAITLDVDEATSELVEL